MCMAEMSDYMGMRDWGQKHELEVQDKARERRTERSHSTKNPGGQHALWHDSRHHRQPFVPSGSDEECLLWQRGARPRVWGMAI